MNAPGSCVDCGNEAYIKLAGEDERMICAHCYEARQREAIPHAVSGASRQPAPPPSHADVR